MLAANRRSSLSARRPKSQAPLSSAVAQAGRNSVDRRMDRADSGASGRNPTFVVVCRDLGSVGSPCNRGDASEIPMGSKKKPRPQPAGPSKAEPSRGSLDVPELDQISDPLFALDVDGRFTYLNSAMELTLGRPRAGVLGREIWSCWPEAAGTPLHEALSTATRAGPSTFIAHFPPRSTFYEVRVYPSAAGLSVLMCDAGSQAGNAQAGSGGHLEAERDLAVEQHGTWRLDVSSKQLLWSDENFRIFGIPKGTPLSYEAFLATIQRSGNEVIDRSWQSGLHGATYDTEREVIAGNKRKWVRERARLVFDAQGRLIGGFGTTLDITAQKQAERDLAQSRARFEKRGRIGNGRNRCHRYEPTHRAVQFSGRGYVPLYSHDGPRPTDR